MRSDCDRGFPSFFPIDRGRLRWGCCPLPLSGRIGKGNLLGQILTVISIVFWVATANAAESKPNWQTEWERTVKAAEEEGQLTVYVSGYGALIDSGVFQKAYPKIKVTSVTGS